MHYVAKIQTYDAALGINTPTKILGTAKKAKQVSPVAVLLVEKGADVNATDSEGITPLHWAAFVKNAPLVSFLVSKGAKVDAVIHGEGSLKGATPLHFAVAVGSIELVKLLISQGANVNTKDGKGKTPLSHATSRQFSEIVDLLIQNGAKNK